MQLTFFILLALIPSITTLQCYVCNSNENPKCASGENLDDFKHQCSPAPEPYCRKIVQTVNKATSIVRTCGSKIGAKSCYKTAGTNSASVCSCNLDFCNNAPSFNRQQQQMMTIFSSIVVLAITMIVLR